MTDALEALESVSRQIAALSNAIASIRGRYVHGSGIQAAARKIATEYFTSVRTELDACKSRAGLVEEIDFCIQQILGLAESRREKIAYFGQIEELRPYLLEATIDLMKVRGTRLVLSETEQNILKTLTALLPPSATSYEQALRDIAEGARVSWRGTATELRETLREVMDHLAPDDKVSTSPGFQLERDQKGPTQRQKVRYILRARRSSTAAQGVVEAALERVEESTAALARSTYQRGSVSTHIGTTGKEIKNLKRYVDAMLAELLELG